MIFRRAYLLPPIMFILCAGCFITVYIISVALDHVNPGFPYVSLAGTTPPESTIFAQVSNVGAVIIYIIFYIRYQLVKISYSELKQSSSSIVAKLNRISIWVSLPTAIATSIPANFSVSNSLVLHLIGGVIAFGGILIYFWIHTVISYITYPIVNSLNMAKVRLTFVTISTLTSISMVVPGMIAYFNFKGTLKNYSKRGPDDGGFELYLTSTASEWIAMTCFGFFFLTFIKEFKNIVIHTPRVEKISNSKSKEIDSGFNDGSINPSDTRDRNIDEDNNDNVVTLNIVDINREGSKTLSV